MAADGLVNPLPLPGEVWVERANDDASMNGFLPMEPDEVHAI